jgi:uncharacterized protein YbjT (DUF2867 family)
LSVRPRGLDERAGISDDEALSIPFDTRRVDERQVAGITHERTKIMITVMGATGQTGGATARALLAAGEHVRALGRSQDRLADLAAAGAETRAGDAADTGFLADAFRGADAAYVLLPIAPEAPDWRAHQARLGDAIVRAVRDAGVPHVVAVSSVGADVSGGTGFLTGLFAQEQRLRTLTDVASVLALRPGSYFENAYGWLPGIAELGVMADTVAPDAPLPMVATVDVGTAASRALLARDWAGFAERELLGPRDLTYAEVATILGDALGRPGLPYVQIPEDDLVGALLAAGWSADAARLQVEMNRAFSEGRVASRQGRTPETTTPTRFEDVAAEVAAAFAASPPGEPR